MTNDSVPTQFDGADRSDAFEMLDDRDVPHPGHGGTGSEAVEKRVRRRRWIVATVLALVVVIVVAGIFLIQLPYYVLQPGSVRPAEQRIDVSGAPSYKDPGRIMFTTVYVDRATPALLIRAWLDDGAEVRTEKEMYPQQTPSEAREENVRLMADSKLLAKKVALDHLGIDAEFDGDGALVAGLSEQSPSKGILRVGDIITSVDGGAVSMPDDIAGALADRQPGDTVSVAARRSSKGSSEKTEVHRLEVTLGRSPTDETRPLLGIEVQPTGLRLDSKVDVTVDSGRVTGPSAGLAWTLAIIDRLTPGSLTAGDRVAVTGTIQPDGTVGPIGGIQQKVAAVKRDGIKMFLYPAATSKTEQAAMRRIAGDGLELYPVGSVDDAIKVLAPEGLEHP